MSILRSISHIRLGSSKLQIRIDDEIYHFEGEDRHVKNVMSMIEKAQKDPDQIEEVEHFLVGKPRPFYGDFTMNTEGEMYFRDYAEQVSPTLASKIKETYERKDEAVLHALENFQARLMINRNPQARQDLYKFLEVNDLSITPKGYFVSYKAVARFKKPIAEDVREFIATKSLRTGTDYLIRLHNDKDDTKLTTISFGAIIFDEGKRKIPYYDRKKSVSKYQIIGRLDALYESAEANNTHIFVDKHTGKIQQQVGELIQMPRSECDSDPSRGCSYGLHVGNPNYVNSFAGKGDGILIALVSPTDVIAVPYDDAQKMRVCQYFIAGFSELDEGGQIVPVKDILYEDDYESKEMAEVKRELAEGDFERYILPSEGAKAAIDMDEMRELVKKRLKSVNEVTT